MPAAALCSTASRSSRRRPANSSSSARAPATRPPAAGWTGRARLPTVAAVSRTVDAMRVSQFFLPTSKETPAEAQIVSHRLMLRAGLVRQQSAGIYAWLPLGFRVLKKIEQIVREEQNASAALDILMPTIQSPHLCPPLPPSD